MGEVWCGDEMAGDSLTVKPWSDVLLVEVYDGEKGAEIPLFFPQLTEWFRKVVSDPEIVEKYEYNRGVTKTDGDGTLWFGEHVSLPTWADKPELKFGLADTRNHVPLCGGEPYIEPAEVSTRDFEDLTCSLGAAFAEIQRRRESEAQS